MVAGGFIWMIVDECNYVEFKLNVRCWVVGFAGWGGFALCCLCFG